MLLNDDTDSVVDVGATQGRNEEVEGQLTQGAAA